MPKFMDAVPVKRTVQTHQFGDIEVSGLGTKDLVFLVTRHPQILELFKGKGISLTGGFEGIASLGLEIAGDFVAAGLGYAGDKEAIQRAQNLLPPDALVLGTAIFDETFPGGAEDFFQNMARLLPGVELAIDQVQAKRTDQPAA